MASKKQMAARAAFANTAKARAKPAGSKKGMPAGLKSKLGRKRG